VTSQVGGGLPLARGRTTNQAMSFRNFRKQGQSMLRKTCGIFTLGMLAVSLVLAADTQSARAGLSAAQIVDKNVAARGGLQAWRAVQTLSFEGKMGVGGNQRAVLPVPMPNPKEGKPVLPHRPTEETQLPFLMEMKRPRKMRLELQFKGQTAVQVYDGTHGWKLRPYLNRNDYEPYSEQELKRAAADQEELDGPLVDYVAKGTRVELAGSEKVEGRDTYKLKVIEKTGHTFHLWVDAETFLETKIEGQPRRLDGTDHPVEVYYRDYRTVDGLEIPFVMETRVLSVGKNSLGTRDTPVPPEKMIIEKVVVNPKIDEKLFSKMEAPPDPKSK
jgi:hypothetical protein